MDHELRRLAVAKLLAENRLPQEAIAKALRTSQTSVSRIVRELRESNQIQEVTTIDPALRNSPEWRAMENELFRSTELRDKVARLSRDYAKHFQLHLVSIPDGQTLTSGDVMSHFGRAAAAVVSSLLCSATNVGISCGRTIHAMVQALSRSTQHQCRVIPILGEPVHLRSHDQSPLYSATSQAEAMQMALHGTLDRESPVLRGVFAYLARRFRGDRIQALFDEVPGYHAIFKKPQGQREIDRLEMILTGVGIVAADDEHLRGTLIKERLEQEDVEGLGSKRVNANALDQIVHGDLAGILIPRDHCRESPLVNELNTGLLGLQSQHLQHVCKKVQVGKPGVVLLAFGERKIQLVRRAIERGIVTTLITTEPFARALADDKDPPEPPTAAKPALPRSKRR